MTAETDRDAQDALPSGMHTETLARLYLRQGYLDKALHIYRCLAEENPDDPRLREQFQTIQQQQEAVLETPLAEPVAARSRPVQKSAGERAQTAIVIARLESWLRQLRRQPRRV